MPKRSGLFESSVVRGGLLVVATVSAMAALTSHGLGVVLADRKPDLALRFAPYNANALAAAARRRIRPGESLAALAASETAARTALARSPVLASALTSIGMVADLKGDRSKANRLLRSSVTLTRRDLPTRLWLIEEAVSRGEVGEALGHYDIALRTSLRAPEILFPKLGGALSDPVIADEIGRLFEKRPPWMNAFIYYVATSPHSPETLGAIVGKLRPVPTYNGARLDQLLVENFVTYGKLGSARALGIGTVPAAMRSQWIIDPSFVDDAGLPPINWVLTDSEDVVAERSVTDSRSRLIVTINAESDAIAASQVLSLQPGSYQLASEQPDSDWAAQKGPYWTIACGGMQNQQIGLLELLPQTSLSRTRFTVPATEDCKGQWLRLYVRHQENPDARTVRISQVRINRVN